MDTFEKKVLKKIKEYRMFEGVAHCVCGVSGGADSVSLLTVLARYRNELGIDLHVVHINHMIRGRDADQDQAYVEELCREYNVDCLSHRIDVRAMARAQALTVEEAGRNARYEAFEQQRCRYEHEGCNIAVAHNRNDVAETVLFNMARGTGMGGVKGIAPVRKNIVRPLIGCDREQIEEYLRRNNIRYCTDITNEEDDYTRNRIRHNVIPVLKDINDQAVEHICAMARMACDYEKLASDLVKSFLCSQGIDIDMKGMEWKGAPGQGQQYRLKLCDLEAQNPVVQELAIRQLTGMVCGGLKDIGRSHVSEIMKLYRADTGAGIDLPSLARVFVQYGYLVFVSPDLASVGEDHTDEPDGLPVIIDNNSDGRYRVPGGWIDVRVYDRPDEFDITKKEYTKYLDYDKIKKCLHIRTYEKGDYIVVSSSGARKKINRLFTDEKIPADKRTSILLLAEDQEVLWVVGHRINENYKVTDDTVRIFEVQYEAECYS